MIKKTRKKRKIKLTEGIVHIHTSYNNTIINVTDMQGNTVAWQSSGTCGFKGTKKSTPYAAKLAVEKCFKENLKDSGLKTITIYIKGIGPGRSSSIKTLQQMNLEIIQIKDLTSAPFNGCRLNKRERNRI